VQSWQQSFKECYRCEDFKDTYCGQDALFMQSCRRSCKLCGATEAEKASCADDFSAKNCQEYLVWGWCDQPKIQQACRKSCGVCGARAASIIGGAEGSNATLEIKKAVEWDWGSEPAIEEAVAAHPLVQESSTTTTTTTWTLPPGYYLTTTAPAATSAPATTTSSAAAPSVGGSPFLLATTAALVATTLVMFGKTTAGLN
jgi:hypothetical protein